MEEAPGCSSAFYNNCNDPMRTGMDNEEVLDQFFSVDVLMFALIVLHMLDLSFSPPFVLLSHLMLLLPSSLSPSDHRSVLTVSNQPPPPHVSFAHLSLRFDTLLLFNSGSFVIH